jgi:hypothetical protein
MRLLLNVAFALLLLTPCQAKKRKLELNLSKGVTYSQRMINTVSTVETLNGQQVKMNISTAARIKYKVIDFQNSIYDMDVRYDSLSLKMSSPVVNVEFNTDKLDEKAINSNILGALINKPFIVRMTKTGKIIEVKNFDYLFSTLFDQFTQFDEAQRTQIIGQMKQTYGEKQIKTNLEKCLTIFPDLPVSTGSKWTISSQLDSGTATKMETAYQLKKMNNSTAVIHGVSKISSVDKNSYIESNQIPMKYDLTGTMASKIKLHSKTGWIMDASINQTITGTIDIKENPLLPGGMKIPITVNNEMRITE